MELMTSELQSGQGAGRLHSSTRLQDSAAIKKLLAELSLLCVPVVNDEQKMLGIIRCSNKRTSDGRKSGLPWELHDRDLAEECALKMKEISRERALRKSSAARQQQRGLGLGSRMGGRGNITPVL
eukprot:2012623-Prymnesium_polylepis.2